MTGFLGSFLYIGLMLAINFAISWWNARSVGKMWSESKAIGGFPRVLAVSGYVMAVAGFTMVYVTLLMIIVAQIQPYVDFINEYQSRMLLNLVGDLSYVLIVMAIVPTGIIIWINSLITFWRHKNLKAGGIAAWNTFATVSNTINAAKNMPSAMGGIKKAFDNNSRGSGNIIMLAIIIVLAAILGGYFTASAIIHKQDKEYDFVEKVTGQKLAS